MADADQHRLPPTQPVADPSALLLSLLDLGRRARVAATRDELAFLLVNGSHGLVPYRQAALWWSTDGVQALSGVVEPERNAPYVTWLKELIESIGPIGNVPQRVDPASLPPNLIQQWSEWLPAQVLLVPLIGKQSGLLLLARDMGWSDQELTLLQEWSQTWLHAWDALAPPHARRNWRSWLQMASDGHLRPWYRRRLTWIACALLLIALLPVRLSVLAPAELVPSHPVVVRSPIEGVIVKFDVEPNTKIEQDQPLFRFDTALIETRVAVARQALETALSQYRQTSQLALSDPKFKAELASQAGAIEEKRSEFEYLKDQRHRSQVLSPASGVVLFDDPSSWIGKPVAVGEKILRIAQTQDIEVEAWLSVADAIELTEGNPVTVYLQANPLSPIHSRLHYFSYEAVQRPDGSYAYRIRARLDEGQSPRLGLKGTARISGRWTVLSYWLLRRPIAALRSAVGI